VLFALLYFFSDDFYICGPGEDLVPKSPLQAEEDAPTDRTHDHVIRCASCIQR